MLVQQEMWRLSFKLGCLIRPLDNCLNRVRVTRYSVAFGVAVSEAHYASDENRQRSIDSYWSTPCRHSNSLSIRLYWSDGSS